jgi:[protein-PII] uridylyltransferase
MPHQQGDESLVPFATLPLREAVVGLKAYRKERFAAVADQMHAEMNEITGIDVTMQLTAITDEVVLTLWQRFAGELDASLREQVGLFALGGYGRGELNPASDLDLVAVVDGKIPEEIASMWKRFQTALWDSGFQVGASCRALGELAHIIKTDYVTATAVLECRPIDATESLTEAMYAMLERWRNRSGCGFLSYKFDEMDQRWSKTGVSVHMNEPEVKTHPGCLRDVQLLRNAAFAALGSRNLHALRELGTFAYPDIDNLFQANDHLLKIRSLLHFEHQRRQDIWLLPDQLRVAEFMGYTAANRLSAVEHLLRDHYALRRSVCESVELARQRLRALGHLGRRFVLVKTRSRLNEDCVIIDRKVYLQRRDFWQQPDVLLRLMQALRKAQDRRIRLSLEFQKSIQQNITTLRSPELHPEAVRLFFAVLGDRAGVANAVRDMHASGLLSVFIPEWQGLVCLKQWGTYHQYTVDEHTLVTLDHYDAVMNKSEAGLPQMYTILQQNKRPDLFVLGLLLHDIGKFMGNGHVERGALMVGDIAVRLHMSDQDEELVHFLVIEHVTLSDATRMRDITDPELLSDIVGRMGSVQRLSLLYSLTWCDARAVGEDILTGWQEALLYDLYQSLREELSDRPEPVSRRQQIAAAIQANGASAAEAQQWLAGMSRDYPLQLSPEEAVWQFQAASLVSLHEDMQIRWQAGESGLELLIAIRRPRFLADCAAVFGTAHVTVESARIWHSESTDISFYTFLLNVEPNMPVAQAGASIERNLQRLITGEVTESQLITQTTRRIRVRKRESSDAPPEVMMNIRQGRWVIDVRCLARPGLLNVLVRALEEFGLETTFASVSTYGAIARDVFYAVPEGDQPINQSHVRDALLKVAS